MEWTSIQNLPTEWNQVESWEEPAPLRDERGTAICTSYVSPILKVKIPGEKNEVYSIGYILKITVQYIKTGEFEEDSYLLKLLNGNTFCLDSPNVQKAVYQIFSSSKQLNKNKEKENEHT